VIQTNTLFWRALLAFLALPAMVAFVFPWLLRPSGARFHATALPLLVLGATCLLWCVRDFYVAGRGTLAPWSPPTRLVTVGLYRYSRNPMYVAVLIVLAGWAVGFGSLTLTLYAAGAALAFHLRVVAFEERWLDRTFDAEWRAYRARVPRWIIPLSHP
jgi:protein-S-isoprenylcysteine O-methyltransferase Ste14